MILPFPSVYAGTARRRFRRGVSICLWAMAVLSMTGVLTPAAAQIVVPDIQGLSSTSQVEEGMRLLQAEQPGAAIRMLRPMLEADSTLVDPRYGSVAYWLGRAYAEAGEKKKAGRTWKAGLRELRSSGAFDPRLSDAYLRSLSPVQLRGERLYAVDVYRSLLESVGTDTAATVRPVYRRRIAQLAPLMSDSLVGRLIEQEPAARESTWTFRQGAGAELMKWWRSLDPLPATDVNERLEEHLTRLVAAEGNYGCAERISGLDDRGIVQLRFGDPYKRRSINYKDGEFFTDVFRFGVNVSASSFPKTEIWLYPHIDRSGYYVFAEEETTDCFSIARANDLIPTQLTMRRADTERGLNIAYSALMAMRAIYRELALYHIDFGSRYTDIANYAGWQKMKATAARAAEMSGENNQGALGERSVTIGAGVGQQRRVFANTALGIEFPTAFVDQMVARAEREDEASADRREEAMPNQYTALLEGEAELPVSLRTARFLNEDGTTRTEVYWGVPISELAIVEEEDDSLTAEPSMITFSAVRYDGQHRARGRTHRRYEVAAEPDSTSQGLAPPAVTLGGAKGSYHLGLQWEQSELWKRDSTANAKKSLGPRRRLLTVQADSMKPLRASGPRIEMSDVRVMTLPDTSTSTLAEPLKYAQPYPFRSLRTDRPLLLSFEVYHLSHGKDDRTRYTVAYEAEGTTHGGGWRNPFQGPETQRTSTEMTAEGTSRRTEETMLLDLSELSRDQLQDVEVTVEVTDEVSGSAVSRTVDFELRPGG